MKIRCKFMVISVTKTQGPSEEIKMVPIISNNTEENKSFSKYTPNGEFRIICTNPNILNKVEPGQEYYIDLISVE